MDIPGLIDIITQKIADMANGKTVEEIREIYGLMNDFSPRGRRRNSKEIRMGRSIIDILFV